MIEGGGNPADVFVDGPLPESLVMELLNTHGPSTAGGDGAQSVFLGRVRADEHDGRRVTELDYECYREMAAPVLQAILTEVVADHGLTTLRTRHSLGRVPAGALCFAVVAAAPHRVAAVEGCRAAVERIKSEVPIYARELLEGGGHIWKRNS